MGQHYTPPVRRQYMSTFTPTNVGFIQSRLQESQDRYDKANIAQATMFASMNEIETSRSQDEAEKQKLISDLHSKYDNLSERYHGNLAAASSELTNIIGESRKSPFWNLNKRAIKQRDSMEKELQGMHSRGQVPLIYKNSTGVMDENGLYRNPEDISYDLAPRSDWATNGKAVIGGMVNTTLDAKYADFKKIYPKATHEDFYTMIQKEGISEGIIDEILSNGTMIDSFDEMSPDFARAHQEIDSYKKKLEGNTPKEQIREYLKGIAMQKINDKLKVTVRAIPKSGSSSGSLKRPIRPSSAVPTDKQSLVDYKPLTDATGHIRKATTLIPEATPDGNGLTAKRKSFLKKSIAKAQKEIDYFNDPSHAGEIPIVGSSLTEAALKKMEAELNYIQPKEVTAVIDEADEYIYGDSKEDGSSFTKRVQKEKDDWLNTDPIKNGESESNWENANLVNKRTNTYNSIIDNATVVKADVNKFKSENKTLINSLAEDKYNKTYSELTPKQRKLVINSTANYLDKFASDHKSGTVTEYSIGTNGAKKMFGSMKGIFGEYKFIDAGADGGSYFQPNNKSFKKAKGEDLSLGSYERQLDVDAFKINFAEGTLKFAVKKIGVKKEDDPTGVFVMDSKALAKVPVLTAMMNTVKLMHTRYLDPTEKGYKDINLSESSGGVNNSGPFKVYISDDTTSEEGALKEVLITKIKFTSETGKPEDKHISFVYQDANGDDVVVPEKDANSANAKNIMHSSEQFFLDGIMTNYLASLSDI